MRAINSKRATVWAIFAALAALVFLVVSVKGAEPAQAQAAEDQHHAQKIVGGKPVSNGKYPFMAALLDTRFGSTAFQQQFCGGALIDQDSVLTAAHCVFGESAEPLRVIVGRTVLDSTQGQVRGVSSISVHPSYNPNINLAFDAAVVELSAPVSGIAPIKLAGAKHDSLEIPGNLATVAGWGNTIAQPAGASAGSSFPDRMREARVPLVSDTEAQSVYGDSFVADLMVAAGQTGKDTCQGDSGGPMFAESSGNYRQIGITSFGIGCGTPGFPGVYAEVNSSSIKGFIVNTASQ